MEWPAYLTVKNEYIYILKTAFPHYLGQVKNFATAEELRQFNLAFYMKNSPVIAKHDIPGYYISIVFAGTLEGNRLFAGKDVKYNLEKEMELMAEFYFRERISKDEKRYLKFKER